jgi:hypothetical protein
LTTEKGPERENFIESLRKAWEREYCVYCPSSPYGTYVSCKMGESEIANCLVRKIAKLDSLIQRIGATLVAISIEHPELTKTIVKNLAPEDDRCMVFAIVSQLQKNTTS